MDSQIIVGDCLEIMRRLPDASVDLVFCSPPYEAARTYGIGFKLRGQDWVDWCVERYIECIRIAKGLVAWVVEGQTRNFRWSAAPALLMADLHRAGVHLRKPPAFRRFGISGSGGPDWLRNEYEFIICGTRGGRLPWSNNTAMGHPPKWAPGGEISHRLSDGTRRNQWGSKTTGNAERGVDGKAVKRRRPSHSNISKRDQPRKRLQRGNEKGSVAYRTPSQSERTDGSDGSQSYRPPVLANPGNVITCKVGGGLMGSRLCHKNEAPFPESLAEFFVRSFCPEGGIVLDPFCGSGTTLAVAERWGRRWFGIDVRESQAALSRRRVDEVRRPLLDAVMG